MPSGNAQPCERQRQRQRPSLPRTLPPPRPVWHLLPHLRCQHHDVMPRMGRLLFTLHSALLPPPSPGAPCHSRRPAGIRRLTTRRGVRSCVQPLIHDIIAIPPGVFTKLSEGFTGCVAAPVSPPPLSHILPFQIPALVQLGWHRQCDSDLGFESSINFGSPIMHIEGGRAIFSLKSAQLYSYAGL